MPGSCKEEGPPVIVEAPHRAVRYRSELHRAGCLGARFTHLDVHLGEDPCGLRVFLSRGGGSTVRARSCCGSLLIDLGPVLGVPCLIRVEGAPWFLEGAKRVYLMLTRRGALYMARAGKA